MGDRFTPVELANERFEIFKEQVLNDSDITTDEEGKKVVKYVKNLIESCNDNRLCNSSIASIFVAAFIDGFKIRDKIIRDGQ